MSVDVSVVVAAYRSRAVLAGCLEALRRQTLSRFETIVTSSPAGDGTREVVEGSFPEVKLIESPTRLLPHAARNRGVEIARGELLVFTDADCRGDEDWLQRLVEAVGSRHEVVCGSIEPEAGSLFELGVHLCKYSFRSSALREGPCTIAGTANAAYTRRVWDAVGPFAGDRFAGDALLSWRAARRGYRPWFVPRAVVRHRFEHGRDEFWRERLERGEDFGRTRAAFERWSRPRAAAYVAAFLLLPLVPLARGARDALRSGHGRTFVRTLPIQVAGHLAWSLGELRAHLRILRDGTDEARADRSMASGPSS